MVMIITIHKLALLMSSASLNSQFVNSVPISSSVTIWGEMVSDKFDK